MRRRRDPVTQRFRDDHRCPHCRLHLASCLCAELPSITTQTRVILLIHQLELRKTTNTGRLALRCLTNSRTILRGRPLPGLGIDPQVENALLDDGPSIPPPWLLESDRPALLFPGPHAVAITDLDPPPRTLIVLDGTWSQATRARNRIPGLREIANVRLPTTLVSQYRLRRDDRPGHVSTLEAVAHALGALEGDATREALLAVHEMAVTRALATNGRL